MFDSMFNSIPGRKSGVDFLLDNQMNFEGCSIWCSILFDTEPEVDIQVFCRSVVVVQARRRCLGTSSLSCCSCSLFVVRCSLFCFYYPELPGLSPVRCAQSDNCCSDWRPLLYLYDFWWAWPRSPVQAPIERWAELADSLYLGKLAPTGFPGVSGRR